MTHFLIALFSTLPPAVQEKPQQEAIEELIRRWRSARPERRDAATRELLMRWNELDAQKILPLIRDPDRDLRRVAANVLGWRGDGPSTEEILRRLGHEDERDRARGAWELGGVGSSDHAEKILPVLKDGGALVRTAAAGALAEMGDPEFVKDLLPLLKDENDGVREAAVWGLGWLRAGQRAESILPMLKDKDAGVRAAAVDALVGMDAREHAESIIQLLEDRDGKVREMAAESLRLIASPEHWEKMRMRWEDSSLQLAETILLYLKHDEKLIQWLGVSELARLPSHRMRPRNRLRWARRLGQLERDDDRRVHEDVLLRPEDTHLDETIHHLPSDIGEIGWRARQGNLDVHRVSAAGSHRGRDVRGKSDAVERESRVTVVDPVSIPRTAA